MAKLATTVPQALRLAANLIEKNGLAVGTFERNGRYCIIGAINVAVYGEADGTKGGEEDGDLGDRAIKALESRLNVKKFFHDSDRPLAVYSDRCKSKTRAAAFLRTTAIEYKFEKSK